MRTTVRLATSMVAVLVAGFQAGATTEIFNLDFTDGTIHSWTLDNGPIVTNTTGRDAWTRATTINDNSDNTGSLNIYSYRGQTRGISTALSSGFTAGTRYTLSVIAKRNYANSNPQNQRVAIAVTQADAGTGSYLMDNSGGTTDHVYQPVVTNAAGASVTNVLLKTFSPLSADWQTVAGTFVYNASLGTDVVVQVQGWHVGGNVDGSSAAIFVDDLILSDNRAPAFSTNLVVAPTGYLYVAYSEAIDGFAPDIEGDGRTFAKDPGDTSWVNVSPAGLVTGTPDSAGTNDVTVYVWDDFGSVTNSTVLRIVVSDENLAPTWFPSSFEMGYVAVGQSYSDSLAGRTLDLNGDPLTYAEVGSGPTWLMIGSGGGISGTPGAGDLGTNSWSVAVSDGDLSTTSSFEVVVMEGTQVYEETFSPYVEMAGNFNNTTGGPTFAWVDSELQAGMWAHVWSTNTDYFNTWDVEGLTDVLEFTDATSTAAQGVGTFIPESTFGGIKGRYVLTYSVVAKDYYGTTDTVVGARIYEASRGANATADSDYYLVLEAANIWDLKVNKTAGSDAYVSPVVALEVLASVGKTLGARTLEFDYSGTNDVVLLIGSSSVSGRARAAIDNVRVFKLPVNYMEWETGYGLTEGAYGDDDDDGVDNITEFGLGLDPTVPGGVDDGALPALSRDGSSLVYVVAQRNNDASLVFNLLTTGNLVYGPWSTNNAPADYTVSGTGTVGSFDYVTNVIDTTDGAKFVKPVVTQTP